MEKSSTSIANTSSENLSLDSSAAILSSTSSAAAENNLEPVPRFNHAAYYQRDRTFVRCRSGAAQARDLPQSPKETANQRFE